MQVELPLGATEDRICGTIDIEKALQQGIKAYEPGLLVSALAKFQAATIPITGKFLAPTFSWPANTNPQQPTFTSKSLHDFFSYNVTEYCKQIGNERTVSVYGEKYDSP